MTLQSNSRREFLTIATAAASTLALPLRAHAEPNITGQNDMTKTGRARQIFKPEFQFGLGGVPLGNEFEVVTEEDAMETLEASWKVGVRYFDVSPWYGLGLAELGSAKCAPAGRCQYWRSYKTQVNEALGAFDENVRSRVISVLEQLHAIA